MSKRDALMRRWVQPLLAERPEWAAGVGRWLLGDASSLESLLVNGDPPLLVCQFLAEVSAGRIKAERRGRPPARDIAGMWSVWAAVEALRDLGQTRADAEAQAALVYRLGEDAVRRCVDDMRGAGQRWQDVEPATRDAFKRSMQAFIDNPPD